MLDCGFTVPPCYWRQTVDQEDLDALWISHFHGDHFFGVPALILRFWEMGRNKPLVILGQTGIEELVNKTMDLAYPDFMNRIGYPLEFVEVEPGQERIDVLGMNWSVAENGHSRRDLAVRIEDGEKSVFYSGDGLPTAETLLLARGADVIIHEAFQVDQSVAGHGNVEGCIAFARSARAGALAIVHIQRDVRRERHADIVQFLENSQDLRAIMPDPGDAFDL